MSEQISPLNRAHEHDQNAQEYRNRGLLVLAAEEHHKAAEEFRRCLEESAEDNTKRTLKKLCDDHTRAGKDLQRRIEKLRNEGKDPTIPQLPAPLPPPDSCHIHNMSNVASSSSKVYRRMTGSPSNAVDESYLVLVQQAESMDDPFDLFWKVTEEMMENLSQPLTFPTAVLNALEKYEDITAKGLVRSSEMASSALRNSRTNANTMVVAEVLSNERNPVSDDEDYDSSDSFLLVTSTPEESEETSSSSDRLRKENAELKRQLRMLEEQISSAQRQMTLRNAQDNRLKKHIMVARKEAQRVIASTVSLTRPGLLQIDGLRNREPQNKLAQIHGCEHDDLQLIKRVREIEEEVRVLKLENERQRGIINKFRERWDRLKESAKRKKDAKAKAHFENITVAEPIEEDPEAEAAAEEQDKR